MGYEHTNTLDISNQEVHALEEVHGAGKVV